jgi:hypothetical protein
MVLFLLAAGAVVAGGVGLGLLAGNRVGSAYDMTVQQMQEQQRVTDYYNQQAYYNYSGGSGRHYYQPTGHHYGGNSYGYYR